MVKALTRRTDGKVEVKITGDLKVVTRELRAIVDFYNDELTNKYKREIHDLNERIRLLNSEYADELSKRDGIISKFDSKFKAQAVLSKGTVRDK